MLWHALQDHYDFGMRALKSVLLLAGALKRAHPDLPEDAVLIRAMRDANLPKFLSQDAVLFDAIVSDLFPGMVVDAVDQEELKSALSCCCQKAGLQPAPAFVHKAVQLHETLTARFGVMLVGPAG